MALLLIATFVVLMVITQQLVATMSIWMDKEVEEEEEQGEVKGARRQRGGARGGGEALNLTGEVSKIKLKLILKFQLKLILNVQFNLNLKLKGRQIFLLQEKGMYLKQHNLKLLLLHHTLNLTQPLEMKIGLGTRFQPNEEGHGKCS
ncbi:uncharacterized protein [Malus domestica]|uniref:uncharacterized protein n=1 Tax=Malus domestica TaxID=3750 RepID=UPI0039766D9F